MGILSGIIDKATDILEDAVDEVKEAADSAVKGGKKLVDKVLG